MHNVDDILAALPTAVCVTDADGRITFCNPAAVQLFGVGPLVGQSVLGGTWTLCSPDGRRIAHDQGPMARALTERRAVSDVETIGERPDGTRVRFRTSSTPLSDGAGEFAGAVHALVEVADRRSDSEAAARLAAIVEFSGDAILATDTTGRITSWNRGAERLLGYTAADAIGQSITMVVPPDRQEEEPAILSRILDGEHIEHYETVRQRKDGSVVDISLTVSPVKNASGVVVGMSKIARDITERRRAEDSQRLLLHEMSHRVKNLLVLASSVVSLSARSAKSVPALASDVRDRLVALARAHDLTLTRPTAGNGMQGDRATTLHALIRTIVSPFDLRSTDGDARVSVTGPDVPVASGAPVTSVALLLHEFVTNAAKYGALSTASGRVEIDCSEEGERFILTWTERGGPNVRGVEESEGFGSLLARTTVKGQLEGSITRDWRPEGLAIRLSVTRRRLDT